LFESDGKRDERRWSFEIVINRLKSITKHNKTLKGVIVGEGISKPDKEQRRILDLLEIKM
jgi:hypothetical protein